MRTEELIRRLAQLGVALARAESAAENAKHPARADSLSMQYQVRARSDFEAAIESLANRQAAVSTSLASAASILQTFVSGYRNAECIEEAVGESDFFNLPSSLDSVQFNKLTLQLISQHLNDLLAEILVLKAASSSNTAMGQTAKPPARGKRRKGRRK